MKKILLLLAVMTLPMVVSAKKAEVRYCTFNIRCIHYNDNLEGWGWAVRRDRVAHYILDNQIDIVGVQEAVKEALDDLLERMPDYDYIGVGREDGVHEGEHMALFYRKDKFELLDHGDFWLSETPDVPSKGWDAMYKRVATWGKFKEKKSGKILMGVNTHFDHVGKEARKQSALLIIDKIKEIVGKKPAVVTGDFNVTEESEAYETITTNEFVLKDAYKVSPEHVGCNYTFQSFCHIMPEDASKIDFIFVTPKIKVKKTCITETAASYIMSDHNPHWADLQF